MSTANKIPQTFTEPTFRRAIRHLRGGKGESGFSSSTTGEEIVQHYKARVKDHVFVITGSSAGLGLECALQICKEGGIVVMGNRNLEKMKAAADLIKSHVPDAKIYELQLDISSLESVKSFVKEYQALKLPSLDYLMNNAGIMANPKCVITEDGIEAQFATNYVGPFLLTNLLIPELEKSQTGSRVINVASVAHKMAPKEGIPLDNLKPDQTSYKRWERYGASKLASIFHAIELNKKLIAKKSNVRAYSCHPGYIATSLYKDSAFVGLFLGMIEGIFTKSVPQGASTQLYCCLSDEAVAGQYYCDCNQHPIEHKTANDSKLHTDLWAKSVELTGSDL